MPKTKKIISPKLLQLIQQITPEQLEKLRHIAMIESIGASTRMAGSKLSNAKIEKLLSDLEPTIYKHKRVKHAALPALADAILQLVEDKIRITMAELIQATQASRSTLKKHLNMLIDQKYLTRHGQGRAVWYTKI